MLEILRHLFLLLFFAFLCNCANQYDDSFINVGACFCFFEVVFSLKIMFTGERKNWILGWFFLHIMAEKCWKKWLEPKK